LLLVQSSSKTRVVLLGLPRMVNDLVRDFVSPEPDIDVVGEIPNRVGEPALLGDGSNEAARGRVVETVPRGRWVWLQRYRVWEADRKVFLYPENELEPENSAERRKRVKRRP
jgi:hypothetical protein